MVWKVVNIGDAGTASKFGANDTDKINKGFAGIDVDDYDINSDFKFRSGKLQLAESTNTFIYTITPAAIAASRILNLPLTTGTDTLATLGLAQTFSEPITIKKNAADLLNIYKDSNTASQVVGELNHQAKDSANNQTTYARSYSWLIDNTNGSEDGAWGADISINGTLMNTLYTDNTGVWFSNDGTNFGKLSSTSLTGTKTFTFPNVSTKLAGLDSSNTFTTTNTFNNSMLKFRNPADTFSYTVVPSAIAGNRNITLPLLTADDVFTFNDFPATLTKKTISSGFDYGHTSTDNIIRGTGVDNPYAGAPTGATVRRTGLYNATSDTSADGIVGNSFTAVGTGSSVRDATEGFGRAFATGAVANNNAGIRTSVARFRRDWSCYAIGRFSISSTSDIRLFFGFTDLNADIAGETTLNNQIGVGIGKRTGDTNWFTMRNDGDATEDRVDTTIAANTSYNTFEMQLNSTNFQCKINGTAQTAQTTEIPATTDNLQFIFQIETGAGAADKTVNILPIFFRSG